MTYSKSVQTDGLITGREETQDGSVDGFSEDEGLPDRTTHSSKKRIERDRELQEEIRNKLRKEIEDEVQASQKSKEDESVDQSSQLRYPLRTLSDEELNAVTTSDDFFDFVERSTRVIERTLDEDYDVLADYELGGLDGAMEDDEGYGKKKRNIKEVSQFWDERWSKKRMITDLSFSPKVYSSKYMLISLTSG